MANFIGKYLNRAAYDADNNKDCPNVSYLETEDIIVWGHDYSKDYLTFTALEDGTFSFNKKGTGDDIQYSLDEGNTWTTLAANTSTPTVSAGNKIMFKAELSPVNGSGIGNFSSTGQFNVEGNPMSLLFGDGFKSQTSLSGKNYAFYRLFYNCTNLVSAENLSLTATTLATMCYSSMFNGCRMLRTAPVLPATTLANSCYYSMFYGCRMLTTAPVLPATTLAEDCYISMFSGCTSLTTAPELPATTLASSCYQRMFQDCSSLTTAPSLPATTLAVSCYGSMFYGCSSLNYIKCLATSIPASNCTTNWVQSISSSGTFVKDASMTDWTTGVNGIPNGWTVVDAE